MAPMETTYTDEELRVAKAYIVEQPSGDFRCNEVAAIIARMEAAEISLVIHHEKGLSQNCPCDGCSVWRKACGRDK